MRKHFTEFRNSQKKISRVFRRILKFRLIRPSSSFFLLLRNPKAKKKKELKNFFKKLVSSQKKMHFEEYWDFEISKFINFFLPFEIQTDKIRLSRKDGLMKRERIRVTDNALPRDKVNRGRSQIRWRVSPLAAITLIRISCSLRD